jgi:hypothetical protein
MLPHLPGFSLAKRVQYPAIAAHEDTRHYPATMNLLRHPKRMLDGLLADDE